MGEVRKRINKIILIIILSIFFIAINLTFWNYMKENPIVEQSGKEYIEREEYVFSDIFKTEKDYIEQKFTPQKYGLKTIGIRLAVNYEGLLDGVCLLIEVCQGSEVIQSKIITQSEIHNWHYYDLELDKELEVGEEYGIRIRQIEGFKRENEDEYWISYVIFHAEEHVQENQLYYIYNGEEIENEIEMYYIYSNVDKYMLRWLVAADIIFILALAGLMISRKYVKLSTEVKGKAAAFLYALLPVLGFLDTEFIAGNLLTMRIGSVVKNLLVCYVAVILLSMFFKKLGLLSLIFMTGCTVLGLVQYFVMLFRGSVFLIQDVLAWRTAASVADRYTYVIPFPIFIALLIVLYIVCVYYQVKRTVFSLPEKGVFIVGIICAMVFIGMKDGGYLLQPHSVSVWNIEDVYQQNGMFLTMASEARLLAGEKPESYSMEKIDEILETAGQTERKKKGEQNAPDNLIIIMNESFSDLEYVNEIDTETTLLPYLHGMDENVIKGWLAMPVFGGSTANSEYEVLTGNTMAFLFRGTPYQMIVSEGEFGLASLLKQQNFYTVAAHPNLAGNWNRQAVYSKMGFDSFVSEENWGPMELIRWCESDSAAYDKVIEMYEESSQKFFTFLVTMQNHGGYTDEHENFQNTVKLNYPEEYPQAEQYLSLIQESDKAFGKLVEYFSEVEEPTMLVMFGDHLPNLGDGFYDELFGKPLDELSFEETQKRYITPFVIWTNYDIEEEYDVMMSANYLGSYILDAAGLEMAPYNQFLLGLWHEIPIISINGICDREGQWYQWGDVPEEYVDRIEEYKVLQYNNIYDRRNKAEKLFSIKNNDNMREKKGR